MQRTTKPRTPEPFTFELVPPADPRALTALSVRQAAEVLLATAVADIPAEFEIAKR